MRKTNSSALSSVKMPHSSTVVARRSHQQVSVGVSERASGHVRRPFLGRPTAAKLLTWLDNVGLDKFKI